MLPFTPMNKMTTTVTKQDESALREWKQQDEELRKKRAELMYRLNVAGFSQRRIAEIYGCRQQFVQQEISKYLETQKVPA